MPNVTISVPDDLKSEMDKLNEVNWSEVSRKAIAKYIDERKNPAPRVEFDLREVRLDSYSFETGSPTLTIPLRIHNMTESEMVVDRILFNVSFLDKGYQYAIGPSHDLYKRVIGPNSVGEAQLALELPREKIEFFAEKFSESFHCLVRCILFAEGFRNPYNNEVRTRIPIDDWNKFVEKVLEKPKIDRNSRSGKNLEQKER
jgi:hypothetical protein